MKKIISVLILLVVFPAVFPTFAQNLSPEEQKKLLEDVKMLKDKVQKLESEKGSSGGSGLKTTDYQSQTTSPSNQQNANTVQAPAVSPEQMKELMETLNHVKAKNEEKNKALQELDENED